MRMISAACLLLLLPVSGTARMIMMVDDFNGQKTTNLLGGNNGTWNSNIQDIGQYCNASFDPLNRLGEVGHSLRLDYDVDTAQTYLKEYPQTAMNGYYLQLAKADLRAYRYLVLYVRGDASRGHSRTLTLELKNRNQSANYVLEGITPRWQRFSVPLREFGRISDWSSMRELVIGFNESVTKKEGTIFVDNIYFSTIPGPGEGVARAVGEGKMIVIDGELDEWSRARPLRLDPGRNLADGTVSGSRDLEVSPSFLWDAENLYLGVRVFDDQIFCREEGAGIEAEDCVVLTIDARGDGIGGDDGEDDFYILLSPSGPGGKPQAWELLRDKAADQVTLAAKMGAISGRTAYQIEAAIPWKYLAVQPYDIDRLGLSVAVNDLDYDDNTHAYLSWTSLPEENRTLLGVLRLTR